MLSPPPSGRLLSLVPRCLLAWWGVLGGRISLFPSVASVLGSMYLSHDFFFFSDSGKSFFSSHSGKRPHWIDLGSWVQEFSFTFPRTEGFCSFYSFPSCNGASREHWDWPGSSSGLKLNFQRGGVLLSCAFSTLVNHRLPQAAPEPIALSALPFWEDPAEVCKDPARGYDLLLCLWLPEVLYSQACPRKPLGISTIFGSILGAYSFFPCSATSGSGPSPLSLDGYAFP